MKYIFALFVALSLTHSASAQHAHSSQRGPNGGIMQDMAGFEAELVISGNTILINMFDQNDKPVSTEGFTASALVVSGVDRETLAIAPAGGNSMKGEAKKVVGTGATVTITMKTATGKSAQARFKP